MKLKINFLNIVNGLVLGLFLFVSVNAMACSEVYYDDLLGNGCVADISSITDQDIDAHAIVSLTRGELEKAHGILEPGTEITHQVTYQYDFSDYFGVPGDYCNDFEVPAYIQMDSTSLQLLEQTTSASEDLLEVMGIEYAGDGAVILSPADLVGELTFTINLKVVDTPPAGAHSFTYKFPLAFTFFWGQPLT